MKRTHELKFAGLIILIGLLRTEAHTTSVSDYNVVWNSQGKNALESIPCCGYDIGLNIWICDNKLK